LALSLSLVSEARADEPAPPADESTAVEETDNEARESGSAESGGSDETGSEVTGTEGSGSEETGGDGPEGADAEGSGSTSTEAVEESGAEDAGETSAEGAEAAEAEVLAEPEVMVLAASSVPPTVASTLNGRTFVLRTALHASQVIDVPGSSTAWGQQVQLWGGNGSNAQAFRFECSGEYCFLRNLASGYVLDVRQSSTAHGTAVQQWPYNGSAAQQWKPVLNADGTYTLASRLNSQMVLDSPGSRTASGTLLQIWSTNGSKAQRWNLLDVNYAVPSTQVTSVADGFYTIVSALSSSAVLDIPGSSKSVNVRPQVWTPNSTAAQQFEVKWDPTTGYYTVRSALSGMALTVNSGVLVPGPYLVQQPYNGGANQQWAMVDNGDGTVSFRARRSNLAWEVTSGRSQAGTALQLATASSSTAQRFRLTPSPAVAATTGIVQIVPLNATAARLEIAGASRATGAAVVAGTAGAVPGQRFLVTAASGGYTIQSLVSGLVLTDTGGSVVQTARAASAADNQIWIAVRAFGGVALKNKATGAYLTCPGSGSNLATGAYTGQTSQQFQLNSVYGIEPSVYTVTTDSGLNIAVRDNSTSATALLELASPSSATGQKWTVAANGSWVTLRSARSGYYMDVAYSGTVDGTSIWQVWGNNTSAQNFQFIPTGDGYFNIKTGVGTWLAAASPSAGTAVTTTTSQATALKVTYTPVTATYAIESAALRVRIDRILGDLGWDNGLRAAFDYVVNNFKYRLGNEYPGQDWWAEPYATEMLDVGSGNCYRSTALFAVMARELGYNARVIAGEVRTGSGWAAHGWVEIYINGSWYMFDPTAQRENRGYNFYMTTMATAPFYYRY
jgi:hypothetical protein